MKMRKPWLLRLFALMLAMLLTMGQWGTVFAEEGKAAIIISGDGIYEVEAGKTTTLVLQVKNKGDSIAEQVHMEPRVPSGVSPFRVKIEGGGDIGDLGSNGYTEIKLHVTVDGIVEEPSYSLPIQYTYRTQGGYTYSGNQTIYLKIKGFHLEPDFMLKNMSLTPENMTPGSSAVLRGSVYNNGGHDLYQMEVSLNNLKTEGISLSGGFNSKRASRLVVGEAMEFTFPLVAGADMAAGNYPVSILLKYQDEFGKKYEKTQEYYINVGGVAGQKADLEIRNMQEPGGTYGVNSNFTVSFDLYNKGAVEAKNIVITAIPVDEEAVVPKSASMKTVDSILPGASSHQSFTFAGTAKSATQNYAIEFKVEYTSGGTAVTSFRQFAGVNVHNPDDDETGGKPKIIISNYESDPLIVMAGEEFDLTMTFLNTHKEKTVSNIKMFLTLQEEKSSDNEKSGNVFTPVNSSNTFYFDSIPPKGTVDKALRLYVVPEAQPKTYTLTVNFEYEDGQGNEFVATELLGINVKQVTELQVDEFTIPETVEQYQPITVAFSYYNTGKVGLSNLMIKVEGDVECSNKNTYIGNLEPGESDYFETTFSPVTAGEVPVAIVISYEDPSGEEMEQRKELQMNVMEPYIPTEEEMAAAEPAMDTGKLAVSLIVLAVLGGLLVLFVKKQKEPPKSTGESLSEVEELEEDADDFVDEWEDKDESL
ncbi:MAG: CARDB domain-containing protein [Bacillota bacterium]|nr:CARDB domain-containing protein [Bacillota bacterium]